MIRASPVLRAAYGALLCTAPGALIGLAGGATADPRSRAVARILGARHLAQAALSATRPSPAVLVLGAQVDLLHSASMMMVGVLDPPRRRIGLTDGVVAAAFAADELITARRAVSGAAEPSSVGPAPPPGPARRARAGDLIRDRDAVAGWLAARTIPRGCRPWLTGGAGTAIRSP